MADIRALRDSALKDSLFEKVPYCFARRDEWGEFFQYLHDYSIGVLQLQHEIELNPGTVKAYLEGYLSDPKPYLDSLIEGYLEIKHAFAQETPKIVPTSTRSRKKPIQSLDTKISEVLTALRTPIQDTTVKTDQAN